MNPLVQASNIQAIKPLVKHLNKAFHLFGSRVTKICKQISHSFAKNKNLGGGKLLVLCDIINIVRSIIEQQGPNAYVSKRLVEDVPFSTWNKSEALTPHRHCTNLLKSIPELFPFNIPPIYQVETELKVL